MSKRKKRKIAQKSAQACETISTQPAPVLCEEAPGAASESSRVSSASIGRGTAVAGMFFTLLLGLYLGTLLPELLKMKQTMPPAPEAPLSAMPAQQQPPADWRSLLPSRLSGAIAAREREVSARPEDAVAWSELGNLYFDAHRPLEAIDAYERALAIRPGNADVMTDLGIMYREVGRPDEALGRFRQAQAIMPGHLNSIFNEGVVLYYDLGRKGEGLRAWQRLLQLQPDARTPDGQPVSELLRQLAGEVPQ